jgi:hypothetical protein
VPPVTPSPSPARRARAPAGGPAGGRGSRRRTVTNRGPVSESEPLYSGWQAVTVTAVPGRPGHCQGGSDSDRGLRVTDSTQSRIRKFCDHDSGLGGARTGPSADSDNAVSDSNIEPSSSTGE